MGGAKEMKTQEVPLMSPQQQQMLTQLLSGTMTAMGGMNLGQGYGGPVESSWQPQPFMGPQQRQGQGSPGRRAGDLLGGVFGRRGKRAGLEGGEPGGIPPGNANLMANLLTGPEANIMTQGMTGNYPKRMM